MIAAILFLLIPAQDALQRAGGEILPVKSTVGRDRIDLRLGPALETDRCTILPSKASVDFKIAPDFACGRFDLAAGYRSLFTKSLREEMLGALIESAKAELASSAMVLACQMSPTLCDAMKHYKLVANDVLALQLTNAARSRPPRPALPTACAPGRSSSAWPNSRPRAFRWTRPCASASWHATCAGWPAAASRR